MLRKCWRQVERVLGRGGGDELLWHMDLKPHPCGDLSIAVVQANSSLEDQSQVFTCPSATFVGVFDGHGGPEASRFLNSHLFPRLHRLASEQGGLSTDIIKKAFDDTEEQFLHLVKRSWPARPQIALVGSCCLVGVISNDVLYVANLGDSRAVLGRRVSRGGKNMIVAERLSTDHNVGDEEVRKEVEALHPDDAHIVVNNRGVWRIKGIIQVQTSLDLWLCLFAHVYTYVLTGSCPSMPACSSTGSSICTAFSDASLFLPPTIISRLLMDANTFCIRKCISHCLPEKGPDKVIPDGLWEQLSDEAVVDIVHKNPRAGIAKRLVTAALQEAAKKNEIKYDELKKTSKGLRRHFHDDITVVVMYLDHLHGSAGGSRFKEGSVDCISAPVDIYSLNVG
ncbi:putative protein phosphatase 2C 63 [Vitis vinifera]|uniref:protein-serine/threonine phosphatase n=1 Tax=Vitis vinifera TaxID=29760 RepID=A0A438ITF0_VITVI|nr:putative protein phosphatase 2C 63 [Vitis vinifera]